MTRTTRSLAIGAGIASVLAGAWLVLPQALLPRGGPAPEVTPAVADLDFETVHIRVGPAAVGLTAWWMPAPEARGVALLLHDGSSNRSFLWSQALGLASELVRRGYHVLAPDLRGHGDSERGGQGFPVGADLAPDVSAWIDFVETRSGGLPVVVQGFGLGGQAALYAAAADRRIAAVVADSTWADLRTSLRVSLPRVTVLPDAMVPALLWSAEHVHGVDFESSRAVDVVGGVGERLLLIQNEADPQIPLRQLRWLAEAAPDAEVWLTPAPPPGHPIYAARGSWGTHTQSYVLAPDVYAERVLDFFDARLQAAAELAASGGTAP
ncbi:MAG: alpha/beta fold hydrolase [Proteobacteria bacterium]|nr:alpha/beta fold hydrolase [Pseudomonadota bacterium]